MARIFSFFLLLHSGSARSHQLSCLVPSFTYHLRPERQKIHLIIETRQRQWRESNPGCHHSKRERYPLHHCLPAALLYYKKHKIGFCWLLLLFTRKFSSKKFALPAAEVKSFFFIFFSKVFLPNVSSAFSARRYFIAYLNFLSPFSVSDALAEIFDKLLANNFHLLYLAQKENVNFCLPPFSNCNKVVLTSQYFRPRVSFSDIDHWLRGKHRFWRPRALIVLGCQPSRQS